MYRISCDSLKKGEKQKTPNPGKITKKTAKFSSKNAKKNQRRKVPLLLPKF